MITKILIVLGIVIAGLLIYAAAKPSGMFISRELLVKASPQVIFPFLNNSRKANEWMPWAEIDPKVTMSYAGPEEGVGSVSSWESTGQMGVGKAEVVESVANQRVKTRLTYTKPMAMSQLAEFSLNPTPEGTVVRWSVSGNTPFVGRLFCIFMSMDKMVGGQFDKGLTELKDKVESPITDGH
jgi:uncharacterized protein YndB with AHSA1/START domain